MVLLAGWLGTFLGALVAAKIARHQTAAALLVALVVMSGVIGMIMKIPHPGWLTVLGLLLPIPGGAAGGAAGVPAQHTAAHV